MLRPQDSSTRERKSLNGLWDFRLDSDPARGSASRCRTPERWRCRPASTTLRPTLQYFGDVWYQRSVWVPPGWQGRRIVLHLESATHRATVWVNDVEVMSHEGGYTPFEADITDHVTPGEEVRITALINNTLHWQSIPPGVIEDTPAGKRQRYWHNFFNYAGIHRTVWLYATDPAHISDVMITSDLDGDTGVINYTECGVVEHRKRAGI
jgi:beta-glucuronidase